MGTPQLDSTRTSYVIVRTATGVWLCANDRGVSVARQIAAEAMHALGFNPDQGDNWRKRDTVTKTIGPRVDGSLDAATVYLEAKPEPPATETTKTDTPLNQQIGGDHYKKLKIQPVEYVHANKLGYFEGNAIKYITRHRDKNGAQDIHKAIHWLQLLLKLEYGE